MPPTKSDGKKKDKAKKAKDGGSPKKGKSDTSPDKKGKKDKVEKKKPKKDDKDAKAKKPKERDAEEKTKKKKDDAEKPKKKKKSDEKTEDTGKKGGKVKKKKKKIPKFEDIMADVAAASSGPDVEAQPELMMEAKATAPEEEQGDREMDTTVPLKDDGTGFSAPRPRVSRTPRPSSARPAAPRPKARTTAEQPLDDTAAPSPQAAPLVMFDEDDDDDDNFVVEEKKAAPDPGLAAMMKEEENLAQQAEEGQHGLLVSQILETKKSMEEGLKGKTAIERDSGANKGKSRDKDAIRKEVFRLRESIQKVTRSANPLGKMMDFLQEDVESMQRELDKWKIENKQMTQQIQAEVSTTNNSIAPLRAAMGEYEQNVQDQLDKISAVRASVLQNEQKIFKLVAGVMNVAAAAP